LSTFGLFALAGMLAYSPADPVSRDLLNIWLIMTAYFGLSIFQVKFRIREISLLPLVMYSAISSGIILMFSDFSAQSVLVSGLLVIKAGMLFLAPEWYRSLRIRAIGFMEMGFQVVFVVLMVVG
jgi:hypothetical protein